MCFSRFSRTLFLPLLGRMTRTLSLTKIPERKQKKPEKNLKQKGKTTKNCKNPAHQDSNRGPYQGTDNLARRERLSESHGELAIPDRRTFDIRNYYRKLVPVNFTSKRVQVFRRHKSVRDLRRCRLPRRKCKSILSQLLSHKLILFNTTYHNTTLPLSCQNP